MAQREGNNKCVQIKGVTHYGSSVTETTEDHYNTFDDLMAFFMERNKFETFSEMSHEIEAFHGVGSIVDQRDPDVTYIYSLVSKDATQDELKQEHDFTEFVFNQRKGKVEDHAHTDYAVPEEVAKLGRFIFDNLK